MKKVLFFTPLGTLTGSEVLLWNFLRHYNRDKIQAVLYSEREGQLATSLPPDVPYYTSPFFRSGVVGKFYKLAQLLGIYTPEDLIINIHKSCNPDCWYLNTVLMFYLMPLAKRLGVKTIVHLNELNSIYECVSHQDMAFAMKQADVVVGITEQICGLARAMGAKRVVHQNCFVDLTNQYIDESKSATLKRKLGINPSAFVWVFAGTPTYRKGFDFLVEIAKYFADRNCHFIWMGYAQKTGLTYLVEQEIDYFELTNITLLISQVSEYYDYLNLANAFLLSSREEPFGNVIIDAASLGKPIVASAEGGAAEFIRDGMGELVPHSSPDYFIPAMERIMQHIDNYSPNLLRSRSLEYSTDEQVGQWESKILTSIS